MKIDRKFIYTILSSGDKYIHTGVPPHEFRALQTWCKNEGLKIRRLPRQGEVEISIKGQRPPADLLLKKNSTAGWLYRTLDRKEKEQDYESFDVHYMTLPYVRSLISRYNRISALKWKVTQPRPGRIIVFKDPVQPEPLPQPSITDPDNLI